MSLRIGRKLGVLRRALSRDVVTRQHAHLRLLDRMARAMDARVCGPYLTWLRDPAYCELWDGSPWRSEDADPRKFVLFELAKSVRHIEGDTVECGVYQGMSSRIIYRAMNDPTKFHHIFDSFDGLSQPGRRDTVQRSDVLHWKKHDLSGTSEQLVRHNLGNPSNVRIYKGWIPERFEAVRDKRFSLVHIDVDLYQPTRYSAQFFLPRMTPGGVLVCDDYGFASCPGARQAMDEVVREHAMHVL